MAEQSDQTRLPDLGRAKDQEWLEEEYIVDTDVHIHEPPSLIEQYIDDPYDEAVARYDWEWHGQQGYMPALEQGGLFYQSEYELPAPYTNGEQVVSDLERLYVDEGILFPGNFLRIPTHSNVDYATALARAYNDYQLDRFVDDHDELHGTVLVAPQDPTAAAEEIDRVGDDSGMKAVFLSVAGVDRPYGHPTYEPIWEAAVDNDLPIAFHCVGLTVPEFPMNSHKYHYLARHTMNHELALMSTAMDITAHGVPLQYPELDFAFLEGGLSWVPMAMHRMDREWIQHREDAHTLTERPSDVISEFYIGTHPLEVPADAEDIARLMEVIHADDNLLFATDIPHHDFEHPAEINKIPVDMETKREIWGESARELFAL